MHWTLLRGFHLADKPDAVQVVAKLIKLGKRPIYWRGDRFRRGSAGFAANYLTEEIEKIADMVIFLWSDKHSNFENRRTPETTYHYTCKHFDKATGNCMNYANRPDMCRLYPNSGVCRYKACTRKCETRPEPGAVMEKKREEAVQ